MLNSLKLFTDKGKFFLRSAEPYKMGFLAVFFGLLWISLSQGQGIALIFQILLFIERQESQRNVYTTFVE